MKSKKENTFLELNDSKNFKNVCEMNMKIKLKLENGMERELTRVKCLAIIPKRQDTHITCCGLNIRMEHNSRIEDCFDNYITSFISKSKTVHGWLINEDMKIPIDIHGGNTNLCYFGYINPSIFENA